MKIIVLDTTTKTIRAALSSAVATSNPDFVVAYADTSDNTFSELSSDGQLNGTTDVTLVGAPASGVKRTIKSISVYNRDTAPVIVVIKLDVSGTQRILQRVQLVSGETWHSDELTKQLPGGSDTQVQFNDGNTLAGSSNFTYNKTTSVLTLGANPVLTAGTANGVLYLNGSKVATSGSALTFDGTTLTNTAGGLVANAALTLTGVSNTIKTVYLSNFADAAANWNYIRSSSGVFDIVASGSNSLAFSASASEGMRLTSTGLGIGTSSPAYKLDVKASGTFNVARFTGQASSISTYIYTDTAYWWFGDGAGFTGQGYTGHAINKTLSLYTDSVERVTVGATGTLTIVSGGLNLGNGGANGYISGGTWYGINSGDWNFQAGNASQNFVWKNSSGSNLARITSAGELVVGATNTGVGKLVSYYTSTAANPLSPANAGLNVWGSVSVRLLFGTDLSSPYAAYIQASNTGTGFPIALNPSGGYVGIGTISPSSIFDVQQAGTAAATTDLLELTNSGNAASMTNTGTGILFNQFYYDATTPAVADAGRIAVKTEGNWTSTASTQDAYMTFEVAVDGTVTERARITSGGSLLVGRINRQNSGTIEALGTGTQAFVGQVTNNGNSVFQAFNSSGSATFYVVGSGEIYSTSTTITAISDASQKENINPIAYGLNAICNLRPVKFDFKQGCGSEQKGLLGFIAQDVEPIIPELVKSFGNEGLKGLKTGDMIPVLVKAIQEQQALITSLTARVAALEGTQP